MKKLLAVFLFIMAFFSAGCSTTTEAIPAGTGTIKVTVSGFRNYEGEALICVFKSEESFKGRNPEIKGSPMKITGDKVEMTFSDLPYGKYVVGMIHDENGNKTIDLDSKGIPVEGWAHSNNVIQEDWNRSVITLNKEVVEVSLNVFYAN